MREIPFAGPDLTEKEIEEMAKVIRSGWLAHGSYSKKFEELFYNYTSSKFATTLSSCTAGLHLSCIAAGFGSGDEVIVPAQTHTATSHAVEYTGAKAVFADVDSLTGNILVSEIKNKITDRTRGVIPVHMAGYPCEMDKIMDVCKQHNLILIEDCAHALGTKYQGVHVGNFGISGNFSFYPTKQITTGEGGILITNKKEILDVVNKYKAFGIDTPPEARTKPGVYDVRGLGYNYRMTDFQAALGCGQMERYQEQLRIRQANGRFYTELLSGIGYANFPEFTEDNSYFLFQLIFDKEIDRDKLLLHLKSEGVGVSIHYATPVPLMSYYRKKYDFKKGNFPNAENYANHSISLPTHSKLEREDISYIVEKIRVFVESNE